MIPRLFRRADAAPIPARIVTLGLKANWRQFALLVLVNAFVGGMAGRAMADPAAARTFRRVCWLVIAYRPIPSCNCVWAADIRSVISILCLQDKAA